MSKRDPEELNDWFAENLRKARNELGIGQQELADMVAEEGLRWHQTTVQRIESGARPVKLAEAVVVAECLGVPLQDMVTLDSDPAAEIAFRKVVQDVLEARQSLLESANFYDLAVNDLAKAVASRKQSIPTIEADYQYLLEERTAADALGAYYSIVRRDDA